MKLDSDQKAAIKFLSNRKTGGLFADIGTGKTIIVLRTILNRLADMKISAACVVAPIRVIEEVWEQEAELWPWVNELTFSIVRGQPAARLKALNKKVDIFLINPDLIDWLCSLKKWPFQMLVIDESTAFKDQGTKRFRRLKAKLVRTPYRIIMTGTPTPNSLMGLWSQMFLVDRGYRLGTSYTWFKRRYFYPADYQGYKWLPFPGSKRRILEAVAPCLFRIEASKATHKPVKENNIWVNLPPRARAQYREMETRFLTEIRRGIVTAANAAVKAGKLLQISNGYVYDEDRNPVMVHEAKLNALQELVEELDQPVLVVYNYLHELAAIKKRFKKAEMIDVDRWNTGKQSIALIHPRSAGHGLNLQKGGHHIIFFGLQYSRELYDQVIGRLARRGQEFTVIVHRILTRNTIDSVIDELLHFRQDEQQSFLSALKEYRRGRQT